MADEEWEEGGDAAAEAFEQVRVAVEQQRGELALMRRAIEGLAAELGGDCRGRQVAARQSRKDRRMPADRKEGGSAGAMHDPSRSIEIMVLPYRSTPIFDEVTLPAALRSEHRTKAGVWGVIRVIEGRLKLTYLDPASEVILTPERPGLVLPEQPHFVEPLGAMRMQVDFYDQQPSL